MQKLLDFIRKHDIEILSFGVGFTLLWAGIGGLFNPDSWIGFVPEWIENFGVSREFFLQSHGVFDIVIALALILNIYRKWAAALAGLLFLSIIVLYGIDDITFRDVGLIAASLVIFAGSDRK